MNDYSKELKKLIKIVKTPKKPFNERLLFYKKCFEEYKNWRLNFKFPKTDFLSRIKTLKPTPTYELVKNLGISISELRNEYLELKGYKQVLIFKLFLFFFSETFKAKNKIKINKSVSGPMSGWITGGKSPARRDIDTIKGEIIDLFKFEGFLSDRYMKYKPGFKPNPSKPMPVGTTWDWAKRKNFKWNSKWKPLKKKYGHQDEFAKEDHYSGDLRSLSVTEKLIKDYENLSIKNKPKDTIKIANLFYELSYCKDFKEIEKIFSDNKKKTEYKEKYTDWLPLKSEIGEDGKAIPWFEDNGGLYKERVFPQFTIKNIKRRFNKKVFLEQLKSEKSIKTCLAMALNGDPELEYAFEYDELLPDHHIITPSYTSGSLFNYLDNDLTFTTLYRHTTTILELSESISDCLGILIDKKSKKSFLLHYSGNRDGTTDCYLDSELKYGNFVKDKNLQKNINKQLLSRFYISPDTVILNKEYKWDINNILKKLKPLAKDKRSQEYNDPDHLEEKGRPKDIGTYIYLLKNNEINKQVALGKMDGSMMFSYPIKRGKADFTADAKISPYSEIQIKHDYFI